MACNCGKRKKKPATSTKPKPTEQQKGQPQQGKTQSFALLTASGRTVFGSELEANAANARQGGIGTVRRI